MLSILGSSFKHRKLVVFMFGGSVLSLLAVRYLFNVYKCRAARKLRHKYPNYTVVLHQYSRGPRAPSLSPYALKVETWLRMANIPYHNVHENQLCVSYNDEYIYHTDGCINFLVDKLGKNIDTHLDEKKVAIAIALKALVEDSLRWCIAIHRFLYEIDASLKKDPIGDLNSSNIKKAAFAQGYGRFTKEEMYAIGMADLKALNDFISTNPFVLGSKVSTLDAVVFAFVSQIINHDTGPLNEYLNKDCPNLLKYHERIKNTFWKDWFNVIEDKNDAKIYFYLPDPV